MDMEEERNPFTLPSDEEVFKMRDEEKRRKKEYRETQSKLRVWEKTTRGKLPTGAERLRQLIGEEAAADGKSWFLCQSPAEGADCEPVESFGGGEEELLCKVPKA